MVNRRDGQFARWLIGSMVDRSDSERLRGFCDGLMYRRTFAILESLLRLKIYSKCDSKYLCKAINAKKFQNFK